MSGHIVHFGWIPDGGRVGTLGYQPRLMVPNDARPTGLVWPVSEVVVHEHQGVDSWESVFGSWEEAELEHRVVRWRVHDRRATRDPSSGVTHSKDDVVVAWTEDGSTFVARAEPGVGLRTTLEVVDGLVIEDGGDPAGVREPRRPLDGPPDQALRAQPGHE